MSTAPVIPHIPDQPAALPQADINAIADLWAERLAFDPLLAQHPDAAWYRERIGESEINDADAATVRLRVMEQCQWMKDRRRIHLAHSSVPETPVQAFAELVGAPEYSMRDFQRGAASDTPERRERRAALFSSLPRENVGMREHRSRSYEVRRFALLCVLALFAMAAMAIMLPGGCR